MVDVWGEKEHYNYISVQSRRIISTNWDIVGKKQQESADRLIVKLKRTKDEVQSLLDGVSFLGTGSAKRYQD